MKKRSSQENKRQQSQTTALLPAYQAAQFIGKTLDSLVAQTHPCFSLIISVDQSTDNTAEICFDYAAKHENITVFVQKERLGYVGNCNFLLEQAETDYVLFAFHDDLLAPTYVERLSLLLDDRPEVVMCYSDVLLTRVDGEETEWQCTAFDGVTDRVERGARMLARTGYWWVPNRGVFRRERAKRIGGLKRHGAGEFSPDWPWLFHMSLLGEFARVPETLCFKYYKADSLSRTWDYSSWQWYEVSFACLRELLHSELSWFEKYRLGAPLVKKLVRLRKKLKNQR